MKVFMFYSIIDKYAICLGIKNTTYFLFELSINKSIISIMFTVNNYPCI